MPTSPNSLPRVNKVSFNNDCSCFSVATSHGFRIYNCHPLREIYRRDSKFDIAVAEIINHTTTAVVKVGSTNILIWDNLMNRTVHQISLASKLFQLCTRTAVGVFYECIVTPTEVKAVKLAPHNLLLVVMENLIFEVDFLNSNRFGYLRATDPNPKGICCAVSHINADGSSVFVCPERNYPTELRQGFKGQIRIHCYPNWRQKSIQAFFWSTVTCLALTDDGLLVAVLSGNSLRIFDTIRGYLRCEIGIPEGEGEICSLAFSPDAKWLASSSHKGAVHVIGLDGILSSGTHPLIRVVKTLYRTFRRRFKGVSHKNPSLEYVAAHFCLSKGVRSIITFGRHNDNTLAIVGMDGSFYRCRFDPLKGGKMIQLKHHDLCGASNYLKY